MCWFGCKSTRTNVLNCGHGSARRLAVGFWPVMAGRQALRSIALPAMYALAVLFFWEGCRRVEAQRRSSSPAMLFAISGIFLGLTGYTYIPARVMWLALPALAAYLVLTGRGEGRGTRRLLAGLGLTLIVAAFAVAPLYFHLANNPGLEVRIDELSAPLQIARDGDLSPLWFNIRSALRLFTDDPAVAGADRKDYLYRPDLEGVRLLSSSLSDSLYLLRLSELHQSRPFYDSNRLRQNPRLSNQPKYQCVMADSPVEWSCQA